MWFIRILLNIWTKREQGVRLRGDVNGNNTFLWNQKENVAIFAMHKEARDMKNLTLTGHGECQKGREKRRLSCLMSLFKRKTDEKFGGIGRLDKHYLESQCIGCCGVS